MDGVKLAELAAWVDGRIAGDASSPTQTITSALPLQDAVMGSITLADSEKQVQRVNQTDAVAVVTNHELPGCNKPQLIVADIHDAFSKIILKLRPQFAVVRLPQEALTQVAGSACVAPSASLGAGTRVDDRAVIGANCQIGQRCWIHSGVVLMDNCQIGDDCEIFPGCVLYRHTVLGQRVVLHANVSLGGHGFGYRQVKGQHLLAAQLGWVEIEDDVEIGANCAVDRGTYGPTRIGCGTKIDNLVHIAHNCHIGRHNLICSQVGFAGSCSTGDYVVMGGQVGLADHLHVGDRATLAGRTGVMRDVAAGDVLLGTPAGPIKQKMLEWAIHPRLPEMRKDVRDLLQRVAQLESALAQTKSIHMPAEKNVA